MRRVTARRLLAIAAIVLIVLAMRSLPLAEWLEAAAHWVEARPVLGPVAYLLLTVLATVALFPGWVPMALAGVLFGLLPGLVLGTLGITLGAVAAMLAGRTLARSWVAEKIAGNATLAALDEALGEQAFFIVFLTRVAMVLPFNLLNYAYGITRVGLVTYTAATVVGMLPIVAVYVYLGSVADDIGAVIAGDARPAGGWWIVLVGVAVIAVLIAVVRRTVKRVLDAKLETANCRTTEEGDTRKP